ncbi:TIR domain-containing protein [Pseudomonas akapageensis]|uniref:TIR domain-containing protein n=1 Tax=Pseudomonas akapageensis TaxID=2609961 RepID=UPI001407A2B9|nr:TIR domain-containing protein [Pseudomonas akapageensis]
MQNDRKRYACFISYKHGKYEVDLPGEGGDSELAKAVHTALHKLARPWWKVRALHVFRDETILGAEADLTAAIHSALENSEYFLLIASPQAAKSPWVAKELNHWLKKDPRAERVLIARASGDLVWNSSTESYDPVLSTALPPLLSRALKGEPLWVDLNGATSPERRLLDDPDFRAESLKLAARLHGKTPEQLNGEDLKRRRQVWNTLTLGLIITTGLAAFAWWQRDNAVWEQARSEAGQLALQAQASLEKEPRRASVQLSAALERLHSVEAPVEHNIQLAIRQSLHTLRDTIHWSTNMTMVRGLHFTDSQLLIGGVDLMKLLDSKSGKAVTLPWSDNDGLPLGIAAMSFSPRKRAAYIIGPDFTNQTQWRRISLDSKALLSVPQDAFTKPVGLDVLENEDTLISSRDGTVRLLNEGGELIYEWKFDSAGVVSCSGTSRLCVVADRSPTFTGDAVTPGDSINKNARVILVDLESKHTFEFESPHAAISKLLIAGYDLWSIGSEGLAQRYRIRRNELVREDDPIRAHSEPATALASDAERLAIGSRAGLIRVWLGGADPVFELRGHISPIRGMTFDPTDKCQLWSLSDDGEVRAWDLCYPIAEHDKNERWDLQSPSGNWLVSSLNDGLLIWHDGLISHRTTACAERGTREGQPLAISDAGDVLVKCPGTDQTIRAAEWIPFQESKKNIPLPEDEYLGAWFLSDGTAVLSVGSFLTVIEGFPAPSTAKTARLLRFFSDGRIKTLDLQPFGLAQSIAEIPGADELLVGTGNGLLLKVSTRDWSLIEKIPLTNIVTPNSQRPLEVVKSVSCCLMGHELIAVIGYNGVSAALGEMMSDKVVVFDLETQTVKARMASGRRLVRGLLALENSDQMAIVFGGANPFSYSDLTATLQLFDRELRAESPSYPLQIDMLKGLAFDKRHQRLSVIGEGERSWIDINLEKSINTIISMAEEQSRKEKIDQWLETADKARVEKNWPVMESLCTRVVEVDPDHEKCWIRRGNARLNQGNPKQALIDYERADRLEPFDAFVPLQRTKALIALRRYQDAENEASKAIERAYLAVRPPPFDNESALGNFNRSIAESTLRIARIGQAEPWVLRAQIRIELGKFEEARSDLDKVSELGLDNQLVRDLRQRAQQEQPTLNLGQE